MLHRFSRLQLSLISFLKFIQLPEANIQFSFIFMNTSRSLREGTLMALCRLFCLMCLDLPRRVRVDGMMATYPEYCVLEENRERTC